LKASRISEVIIEESLYGWKEFELEVIRDKNHNVVVVCSIDNVDPVGVHTGDSITVAPAQTLTDREYQQMRDGELTEHPRSLNCRKVLFLIPQSMATTWKPSRR
jgi:carbamoyl-phosphate synthase large subunit